MYLYLAIYLLYSEIFFSLSNESNLKLIDGSKSKFEAIVFKLSKGKLFISLFSTLLT